jgi:hypothetical protein
MCVFFFCPTVPLSQADPPSQSVFEACRRLITPLEVILIVIGTRLFINDIHAILSDDDRQRVLKKFQYFSHN